MDTKYVYTPEKEYIYLYKDRPITIHYAYGYTVISDLAGNYIDSFDQYSEEDEKISQNSIGTVIRPRWEKQQLSWHTIRRGLKYDETIYS